MKAEPIPIDVGGRSLKISSPAKVMFPAAGVTKEELVRYYIAVGDGICAALRDRPTTLHRFPDGVEGEAFFQKRVPAGAPDWVQKVRIQFPSGRYAEEVCPTEPAVFAWAANLGTVEFHPWPVRRPDVDHPDEMRIDFDPQPGTTFADAVTAATAARAVLADAGCTGFPKTSGGRGVHVSVPIAAEWTFTQVRRAVIALGRELNRQLPELVTVDWWKEERGERVFIDFNQAARDRTMAAAYSVRATPQATVSAPVTWDELGAAEPLDFTVRSMPERFASVPDPRAGFSAAAGWTRCWSWPMRTSVIADWATCRIRRSIRRCPASRSGSSPAAPGPSRSAHSPWRRCAYPGSRARTAAATARTSTGTAVSTVTSVPIPTGWSNSARTSAGRLVTT